MARKVKVKDLAELRDLVAANIDSIEPGLEVIEAGLRLGAATVDLVGLDANGSLVLMAVGSAKPDTLLALVDAHLWCCMNPDNVRRLYPSADKAAMLPPRIVVVSERLAESFVTSARQLSVIRIEAFECQQFEVKGQTVLCFEPVTIRDEPPSEIEDTVASDEAREAPAAADEASEAPASAPAAEAIIEQAIVETSEQTGEQAVVETGVQALGETSEQAGGEWDAFLDNLGLDPVPTANPAPSQTPQAPAPAPSPTPTAAFLSSLGVDPATTARPAPSQKRQAPAASPAPAPALPRNLGVDPATAASPVPSQKLQAPAPSPAPAPALPRNLRVEPAATASPAPSQKPQAPALAPTPDASSAVTAKAPAAKPVPIATAAPAAAPVPPAPKPEAAPVAPSAKPVITMKPIEPKAVIAATPGGRPGPVPTAPAAVTPVAVTPAVAKPVTFRSAAPAVTPVSNGTPPPANGAVANVTPANATSVAAAAPAAAKLGRLFGRVAKTGLGLGSTAPQARTDERASAVNQVQYPGTKLKVATAADEVAAMTAPNEQRQVTTDTAVAEPTDASASAETATPAQDTEATPDPPAVVPVSTDEQKVVTATRPHPALDSLKFPKDGLSRQWLEFLNQLAAQK